jgi:hypothetical protein
MIHPHPSIVEGVQECVRMLLGKSVYKSSIFKDKLKCYRRTVKGEKLPLHVLRAREQDADRHDDMQKIVQINKSNIR